MRTVINLTCTTIIMVVALTGCQQGGRKGEKGELLAVDFTEGATLRYRLVSERTSSVDLDSTGSASKSSRSKPQITSEKLEMVIAYRPVVIDPYGLSTIEGTCKSAKVTRNTAVRKDLERDAVENLAGQKFTFQISPTGGIVDYSDLNALIQRLGDKAFASKTGRQGRVKNPDMIYDFAAMQWYLWDSIANIENAADGAVIGQSWKSTQFIPLPMPIRTVRETTYTLSEVQETQTGRKAVIDSSCRLSDSPVKNWPRPYTGKFNMKGMFGFLRNYKFDSLEGSGRQVFDIDAGRLDSKQQEYKLKVHADFLLPLGDTAPTVTIEQKMSAQLLGR